MEKAKKFGSLVARLIQGENITREESKEAFYQILNNEQTDMQQGAFLAALTAKGETAEEIAGSWEAIYDIDTVKVTPETDMPIVDNCGTGMDSFKSFNISTVASIIAAAAGIPMAKHGSRAITSSCGTIDIVEALGVDVECDPEIVKNSIEKAGIGMFNGMSPKVHPHALVRVLSQITFGTVLNISGSLANPALPKYAVRGVYTKDMLQPVAEVMREIGYKKALIVHGTVDEGALSMDEASTMGETFIAELKEDGEIIQYSFTPEELGIKRGVIDEILSTKNLEQEALSMISLLKGQGSKSRFDIACLNAGLILYLMKQCSTIKEGYEKSKDIVLSGKALDKLQDWVREQNADPNCGLEKFYSISQRAQAATAK